MLSFLCATCVRLSWLTGWHSNCVIWTLPFFSRVVLWASRTEVWAFLGRIRAVTVEKLTARLTYLVDRLTLACEVLAELVRCVACMNCGVTVYINSELCVLKRVDSISESPGSVRQLNESRFGRTNEWYPARLSTHALSKSKAYDQVPRE